MEKKREEKSRYYFLNNFRTCEAFGLECVESKWKNLLLEYEVTLVIDLRPWNLN
jgi:hypothetical protein